MNFDSTPLQNFDYEKKPSVIEAGRIINEFNLIPKHAGIRKDQPPSVQMNSKVTGET